MKEQLKFSNTFLDFIGEKPREVIVVDGIERFKSTFDEDLLQMCLSKLEASWEIYVAALEKLEQSLENVNEFCSVSNSESLESARL